MKQMTTIGHIGQDATIIDSNGRQNVRFTLAVYDGYTNKDGAKVDRTTWFSVFYRGTGLAPYLKKGSKVFVQGEHNSSLYKKNDGQWSISETINADNIQLLDRKQSDGSPEPSAAPPDLALRPDDNMPF